MKVYNEDIEFGREPVTDLIADFRYDFGDASLKTRKMLIQDVGDPGDFGFGRFGPDNASWDTPRGQLRRMLPNQPIGVMYWRAAYAETDDAVAEGLENKNVQVYARTRGVQTRRSAGGSLHLATTPINGISPIDRLEIEADGTISFPSATLEYVDGVDYLVFRVRGEMRRVKLEAVTQ